MLIKQAGSGTNHLIYHKWIRHRGGYPPRKGGVNKLHQCNVIFVEKYRDKIL